MASKQPVCGVRSREPEDNDERHEAAETYRRSDLRVSKPNKVGRKTQEDQPAHSRDIDHMDYSKYLKMENQDEGGSHKVC